MKPKKLVFDIECSPLKARTWGLYDQNVIWVEQDWELLSVAVKPLGGKVSFFGRNEFSEAELTRIMWEYFDEYDVLIGHNIRRFDIKKMNAKFIEFGLMPPSPYLVEDTLTMAKSIGGFTSNKLGDLSKRLGVGAKVETGGYKLWQDCESTDPEICAKAYAKMEKYNKGDCIVNEKLYYKLLPWANSPKLYFNNQCPFCGKGTQSRGPAMKPNFHRFQCTGCYKWSQRKVC